MKGKLYFGMVFVLVVVACLSLVILYSNPSSTKSYQGSRAEFGDRQPDSSFVEPHANTEDAPDIEHYDEDKEPPQLALQPKSPVKELQSAGFEKLWETHLNDREVVNMWLINNHVYVETKGHWLYKIHGKSGYVLWVYDIGAKIERDPFLYTYEESEKEMLKKYNEIYLLAGDAIHCIDEGIGWGVWTHKLRHTPSSPPFASASHFYYGSLDNKLYAVDKETRKITWEYAADDKIVTSGAQKHPLIFFPSSDGNLYCANASRGTMHWRFSSGQSFTTGLCYYKNRLYAGCRDGNLYALCTVDGCLDWTFQCQSKVVDTPVAVDGGGSCTIYCRTHDNWFYAIDRQKGSERWRLRDGVKLLLVGRKNAYILTSTKEIACVNNKDGEVLWKKTLFDADFFATNSADKRSMEKGETGYFICFGYKNAWFFCIREKDLDK